VLVLWLTRPRRRATKAGYPAFVAMPLRSEMTER
jgi:hypothetical protein